MNKKEVFIGPGDGSKLTSLESVLEKLDGDEQFLLAQHPSLEQYNALTILARPTQDQVAVKTLTRLRALREALQDESTPAWKAAALSMFYQDMVNIYRQPVTASARGKAYRGNRPTRKKKDELAITVLRCLRGRSLTWEQAKDKLVHAGEELEEIAGVVIDSWTEGHGCKFSKPSDDGQTLEEFFALSTLRNKWSKAGK